MEQQNKAANPAADIIGTGINGLALAKAILEDYATVVAKLEGMEAAQVKERIMRRQGEIFRQTKADILSRAGKKPEEKGQPEEGA